MAMHHVLPRILSVATLLVSSLVGMPDVVQGAQVGFDLPNTIECRDVTPADFATAHPTLKVIEAKFRISARIIEGKSADIVDFLYVLTSTDKTMRLQDYLPNTTLESAVADDRIEITDASENCKTTGAEAHVVYKPFTLSATHGQNAKKSESSHYKQIAAKDLVLASGTTNREHGVFFRLRPSRAASLEGGKEFTFLAIVPKSWRGDLCKISCAARANKSSLISSSIVPAGAEQAQVGMYLQGDLEAATLAEELRQAEEARAMFLTAHRAKDGVFDTISSQAAGLFTGKKTEQQAREELREVNNAVKDVENRLRQFAR